MRECIHTKIAHIDIYFFSCIYAYIFCRSPHSHNHTQGQEKDGHNQNQYKYPNIIMLSIYLRNHYLKLCIVGVFGTDVKSFLLKVTVLLSGA